MVSSQLLRLLFLIFLSITATFSQSQSQSLTLKCKYEISNYNEEDLYTCYATELENHFDNAEINITEGKHLENYDDSKVEALTIENQNLSFLPNGLNKIFNNLIRLEVTESELKEIKKSNFDGMNLENLKIRKNLIKNIENGAFDDLENLKELNLDENEIENLNYELFTKNSNLKTFSIENNKLIKLSEKFFTNLPKLQHFHASYNQLKEIPTDIFENCSKLKSLELAYNNLNVIPSKIIENLIYFDFSNNSCISGDFIGTKADENFDDNSTFIEKLEELCGENQTKNLQKEDENEISSNEETSGEKTEETSTLLNLQTEDTDKSALEEIKNLLADLETEFDTKMKKIKEMSEILDEKSLRNLNDSESSKNFEKFKEDLQNLYSNMSNLKFENENLKSDIDEQNLKLKDLEKENESLETENKKLSKEIEELKTEKEKLEQEISNSNESNKILTDDMKSKTENFKHEFSKFNSTVTELSSQNSELTSKLEKSEENLRNSTLSLRACENNKENFKNQYEEISRELTRNTNENSNLNQKIEKCNGENYDLHSEKENLLTKVQKLEAKDYQTNEMLYEIENLRNSNEEKTKHIQEISKNFSYLQTDYSTLIKEKENLEYDLNICKEKVVYFEKNRHESCEENQIVPEASQSHTCCNQLQIYKSVPLECDFLHIELEYSCKSTLLVIIHRHMSISETRGNHITRFIDNSNVKRLHVIDAIFKYFTNDIFNHFESIESLEIINSQLLDLNDEKIHNENLKFLKVEANLIEILESEVFSGIKNAEIIILSNNKIENVEPLAFAGLFKLQKLDLKNNKISSLHHDVFEHLESLTHISLSNNKLEFLQGNLLANQKHLLMVKFDNNPILYIENDFLNYSTKLESVDFADTCVGLLTIKGIEETKLRIKEYCK